MTLREAIEHCKEKSCGNTVCAQEHKQLAEWLEELKELRSQLQWKPSNKQIEAIKDAIEFLGCTRKVREDLKSLYEQLKKLKE